MYSWLYRCDLCDDIDPVDFLDDQVNLLKSLWISYNTGFIPLSKSYVD